MNQIEKELNEKSKRGFFFLAFRSFFIHILQAASILLISRWLSYRAYGVYGILNSWIAVSWFFCDLGTTGALVQQKEHPTDRQLQTSAAIHFTLASFFAILFWVLAPFIIARHHLAEENILMMRLLGLTIPIYAVRSVPKLILERRLEFRQIGKIEIFEVTGMYFVQIILAGLHAGAWSLVFANITRALIGTVIIFSVVKKIYWPRFRWSELKPLLPFGLPYQANGLIPAIKGLLVPLLLGSLFTVEEVGLAVWTIGIASTPMLVAMNFNQVVFPGLARLQANVTAQKQMASRGIEMAELAFGYVFGLGVCISPKLVGILFIDRWLMAIPLLPMAMLAFGVSTISYLGASILNAKNHSFARLSIEVLTLIIEFGLGWYLCTKWKLVGYFAAMAIAYGVNTIISAYIVRSSLRTNAFYRFFVVFLGSFLSYITLSHLLPSSPLVIQILVFHLLFFGTLALFDRSSWSDLKWLYRESVYQLNALIQRKRHVHPDL